MIVIVSSPRSLGFAIGGGGQLGLPLLCTSPFAVQICILYCGLLQKGEESGRFRVRPGTRLVHDGIRNSWGTSLSRITLLFSCKCTVHTCRGLNYKGVFHYSMHPPAAIL